MGLRKKILLTIGTTLILMVLIIYSITNAILLGGYKKLERQNILQNTDQAINLIDDELNQLKSVVGDWAPWDDTYQFVQDVNQAYIDNNLMDSTVVNLHVNFLIFINTDKKIVYCKFADLETGEGGICPDSLIEYILSKPFISRDERDKNTIAGLIILPENPVLLASAPILTSQFKGPVAGTLIAGRYLNTAEVKRLASKVNLSIKLQRFDSEHLPDDFLRAKKALSPEKRVTIMELSDDSIAAYTLIMDLQDKPVLMLGIDKERKIFSQGKTSMKYLVFSLLITGLVFIIAALFFLERIVLSRMVRLNSEVKDIGETGNLLAKTSIQGEDELADLSCEINQMLEAVRVSTERDRAILDSIEDGYFELDLDGNLNFYNDSLSRLFKIQKEGLKGKNYRQLLDDASAKRVFTAFKQLYITGRPIMNMETRFKLEHIEELYLEYTVSLIKDTSGKPVGFRGIARDITERKKSSEKLIYMVYHDSLTGLLNRKAFHEDLENELLYAERYRQQRALLFIDLDKFKEVNDTYGHDTGDQFLKGFANRVKKNSRKTEKIYRLGGDEFAIILTNPHEQLPEVAAQRIIDLMAEPFFIGSQTIDFVTTSIGISIFPMHGTDTGTLFQCADNAMYKAKEERNTLHIYRA